MGLGAGRGQDGEGTAQLHGRWVGGEIDSGCGRMTVDEGEVQINVPPEESTAPLCRPRHHRL